MVKLDDYIQSIREVIPPLFAPNNIYYGKEGALRLAREVSYGLKDYPEKEIKSILGELYGKLLVANCLTTKGVPLSAKEFNKELLKYCV